MDYSKLSDFEINKSVAHALGNAQVNQVHDEIGGSGVQPTIYKKSGLNREGLIIMHPFTATKDFCNKPEDAWPIISENGISLIKCTVGSGYWSAEIITDIDDVTDKRFQCQSSIDYQDANPLRAAMVVFLMMQEK